MKACRLDQNVHCLYQTIIHRAGVFICQYLWNSCSGFMRLSRCFFGGQSSKYVAEWLIRMSSCSVSIAEPSDTRQFVWDKKRNVVWMLQPTVKSQNEFHALASRLSYWCILWVFERQFIVLNIACHSVMIWRKICEDFFMRVHTLRKKGALFLFTSALGIVRFNYL